MKRGDALLIGAVVIGGGYLIYKSGFFQNLGSRAVSAATGAAKQKVSDAFQATEPIQKPSLLGLGGAATYSTGGHGLVSAAVSKIPKINFSSLDVNPTIPSNFVQASTLGLVGSAVKKTSGLGVIGAAVKRFSTRSSGRSTPTTYQPTTKHVLKTLPTFPKSNFLASTKGGSSRLRSGSDKYTASGKIAKQVKGYRYTTGKGYTKL